MSTAQQLDTAANPAALDASSLLDSIIDQSRIATNDSEKGHTRDLIGELVAQVLDGSVTVSRDLSASIDAREAAIEANKKSPDLIPAAAMAARALIDQAGRPSTSLDTLPLRSAT